MRLAIAPASAAYTLLQSAEYIAKRCGAIVLSMLKGSAKT